MEKKWFIGIAVSMKWHNLAAISGVNPEQYACEFKFDNTLAGYSKFEKQLAQHGIDLEDSVVCMEHTGTHSLLFIAWLQQRGIFTVVEPALQIKKSLGMQRGKNDQVDARRIAEYAFMQRHKLKEYKLHSRDLLKVKQLLTYREQLIKTRTMYKNSLKSHQQYDQLTDNKSVIDDIDGLIRLFDEKINKAEQQIIDIIGSDEELKRNYKLANSVKGVGLVISAMMLVTTHNFTAFSNARTYNCYTGLAPYEHTSGTSIKGKTRTSHLGHKRLKAYLNNGANSACNHDPEIRMYYKRKKQEGKEHKLIMNAIANKIVSRVFAVVNRQTPYVSIYKQKFN
jgi:transposase